MSFPNAIRSEFPSLSHDYPDVVFADGSGGSQVPHQVLTAMMNQMRLGAANLGGLYPTSMHCFETTQQARLAVADLLYCHDPSEIVFLVPT